MQAQIQPGDYRALLTSDGVLVLWPHARIDVCITTLRAEEVRAMLAPNAWDRMIAHAHLTTTAVHRLYSRTPGKRKRGLGLRRTGRRIVAAGLQEDVVGLNEETLKSIFAVTSDRLELLALIYAHNPKRRIDP